MRTLALPDAVQQWSLTTLREKLIKIVRHGRHVIFQMAEAAILRRIDRKYPTPSPPFTARFGGIGATVVAKRYHRCLPNELVPRSTHWEGSTWGISINAMPSGRGGFFD